MTQVIAQQTSDRFVAYNGDCVEVVAGLPDASVGFSIYSPPFSHLFVYSDSERDMGNVRNDEEFFTQYGFLLKELHRVTKPGRLTAVHCSDLPRTKSAHGEVGMYDMPGDVIRAHCTSVEASRIEAAIGKVEQKLQEYVEEENFKAVIHLEDLLTRLRADRDAAAAADRSWVYHSRICVWKDPVVEMQRTKALGLLYKQLQKDSTRSRQGMPDYVLVFRKTPDDEKQADRVGQDATEFPVHQWQEWASPVWMDINQTDVLNVRAARETDDERHLCPLQIPLIERAIRLWSNKGDTVLSPFMGIGSEGYGALRCGRRFVGVELKGSYFHQAVKNLRFTEAETAGGDLLTGMVA